MAGRCHSKHLQRPDLGRWRLFAEDLLDVDAFRIVREILVEEHNAKRLAIGDRNGC